MDSLIYEISCSHKREGYFVETNIVVLDELSFAKMNEVVSHLCEKKFFTRILPCTLNELLELEKSWKTSPPYIPFSECLPEEISWNTLLDAATN